MVPYCHSIGSCLRPLTMADYLKKRGCAISILAAKGHFIGYHGLKSIVDSLDVHYKEDSYQLRHTKTLQNYTDSKNFIFSFLTNKLNIFKKIIKNSIVPDIAILYIPKFIARAYTLIKRDSYTHIIVTSPPHSTQLVGLVLKLIFKLNLKLIVDYRDGWNTFSLFTPKNKFLAMISSLLEQEVLRNSDCFIYQSKPVMEKIIIKYPALKEKLRNNSVLVRNGYSRMGEIGVDYNVVFDAMQDLDEYDLVLGYFGGIDFQENSYRNPVKFMQILNSIGIKISLHIYTASRVDVNVRYSNINIKLHESISLAEAKAQMRHFDALILFHAEESGSDEVIPGKFYEYIDSRRPILGYGPRGMECLSLIKYYDLGYSIFMDYEEYEFDCFQQKIDSLKSFRGKDFISPAVWEKFSREEQYKAMFEKVFHES
jgi:hypothetical protein